MGILETRNPGLEQALFQLGVQYLSCDRDLDGMTVWKYRETEKTRQIFNWFKEAVEQRTRMGW